MGEDEELVGRFLSRRSEEAFAALYRRHAPAVYGLALRLVGHNVAADSAAARAALESKGVKFPRPTAVIPGKVALAEFQDPDGNRLRFAGPAPAR